MIYRAPPSKAPLYVAPIHPLATRCWHCGYECDSVYRIEGRQAVTPSDGDVSICLKCSAPAIFDRSIPDGVRKPSPSEMDAVVDTVARIQKEKAYAKTVRSDPGQAHKGGTINKNR